MSPGRFRLARLIAVVFLSAPLAAVANLSSLKQERFASYLTLSDSPTSVGTHAVSGESSATNYSDSVRQNIAGEFGFLYATSQITWRFGLEILKPSNLSGAAKDDSGTKLYDVQSVMIGFLPKIGLEYSFKTTNDARFFVSGSVGSASLQVTNDYTNVTVSPTANFTLKEKASTASWGGSFGVEWFGSDQTSLVVEAGYRNMNFGQVIYGGDATDFTGAKVTGDPVKLKSGERRRVDLSGAYLAAGFRWWLF